MAVRFWVGGTGNWNDTAHWSTTSGGASGASVPSTSADSATFDGSSGTGTVTVNINPTLNTMQASAMPAGLSFSGTYTLTVSDAGGAPNLGSKSYDSIVLTGSSCNGSPTCTNLTITGSGTFNIGGSWGITTLLTLTGTSNTSRLSVRGLNNIITLNAASVSLSNIDFVRVTGAGTASPFTGTRLGDIGSNSGITFDATRSLFWVGGAGSWNDSTHWSLSSGGSGGQPPPLLQDDCTFDDNSFSTTGQVIVVTGAFLGRHITFTTTKNPVLSFTGSVSQQGQNGAAFQFAGNLTLSAGMTTTGTANPLVPTATYGSVTLDCQGVSISTIFAPDCRVAANTFTLLSALVVANEIDFGFAFNSGSTGGSQILTANGFNVTCTKFSMARNRINMGSGTWTLNGNTWRVANPNAGTIVVPSTSRLVLNNAGAGQGSFDSGQTGSLTISFNIIEFTGSGAGGWLIARSDTYSQLVLSTTAPLVVTAGKTITITTLTASGGTTTAGKYTMKSSSAGTAWNLSKSSGTVTVSFLSLQDSHAAGGATFNDSPQSMNVSGNTGWNFGAYPVTKSAFIVNTAIVRRTAKPTRRVTCLTVPAVRRLVAAARRSTVSTTARVRRSVVATRRSVMPVVSVVRRHIAASRAIAITTIARVIRFILRNFHLLASDSSTKSLQSASDVAVTASASSSTVHSLSASIGTNITGTASD